MDISLQTWLFQAGLSRSVKDEQAKVVVPEERFIRNTNRSKTRT